METENTQLLFVYNANSGLGNAMLDTAHKILNPATYSCSLCQLTYGAVREKANWKRFRQGSAFPMHFLHKDEFAQGWGEEPLATDQFPAIFLETAGALQLLVHADELNTMNSEKELIRRVEEIIEAC